jgi:hypothetical protein
MQEIVARVARNEMDSTPTQERASIDAIPEFACNFYNLYRICDAHSNVGAGAARAGGCSMRGGYGPGLRL